MKLANYANICLWRYWGVCFAGGEKGVCKCHQDKHRPKKEPPLKLWTDNPKIFASSLDRFIFIQSRICHCNTSFSKWSPLSRKKTFAFFLVWGGRYQCLCAFKYEFPLVLLVFGACYSIRQYLSIERRTTKIVLSYSGKTIMLRM